MRRYSQQFAVEDLPRAEGKVKLFRSKPSNDTHLFGHPEMHSQTQQSQEESEQLNKVAYRASRPGQPQWRAKPMLIMQFFDIH